ncbi:unnamed protein product [Rhizophagus irregularis]|nr:unnamed protein product [Rhizophagus irregularis]
MMNSRKVFYRIIFKYSHTEYLVSRQMSDENIKPDALKLWKVDGKKVESNENSLKEFSSEDDIITHFGGEQDVHIIVYISAAAIMPRTVVPQTTNFLRSKLDFRVDTKINANRWDKTCEAVLYSGDKDVKSRLGKQFFLNVTYGNGSMASDFDVDIKAESSKALRILYSYFVNGNKNLNFNRFRDIIGEGNTNQLRLCLETIYENKLKEDRNINCLAIIIDIDEVNKLYPTFRNLVSIVGSTSYPLGKVFFLIQS